LLHFAELMTNRGSVLSHDQQLWDLPLSRKECVELLSNEIVACQFAFLYFEFNLLYQFHSRHNMTYLFWRAVERHSPIKRRSQTNERCESINNVDNFGLHSVAAWLMKYCCHYVIHLRMFSFSSLASFLWSIH